MGAEKNEVDKNRRLFDELQKKQQQLRDEIEDLQREEKAVKASLLKGAAVEWLKAVRVFRDNFTKGHVLRDFRTVRDCLLQLEELDPSYIHALGTGDIYGVDTGPDADEVKYLVSYLFGGAWKKDADLWCVLAKIENTRSLPGNLFVKEIEAGKEK